MFLKQSTAVVIPLGPFVDKTDGVTLETGLVTALDHASTGILLSKNGGTLTIRHATVTASSYDAHGCYKVTLDATDTNTLGHLRAIYTDAATCLPVWVDFMVLPAMIYDSIVAGTDRLDTNVTHIADTSQTGRDIGASVLLSSGTGTGQLKLASGYVAMTWADIAAPTTTVNFSGTTIGTLTAYTGNTPQTGDSFARIGATGSGLTTLATQASVDDLPTNAELATALGTADDAVLAQVALVKSKTDLIPSDPADASDIAAAFSTVNSTLATIATYIDTEVSTLLTRLGTPSDLGSGASVAANLVDIEAQTDDIGVAGAGLSAIPKTGYKLASDGVDAIVVETGLNARQALSVAASAAAGVLAGAATTTVTIAAAGVPATNRITGTVDASGNRSAVTLNLPA